MNIGYIDNRIDKFEDWPVKWILKYDVIIT